MLTSTYYFFEKFCLNISVKWLKIRNRVISVKPCERDRPYIFSHNCFHKIGKFKKILPRENQNTNKDELMENFCHSLDVLLP